MHPYMGTTFLLDIKPQSLPSSTSPLLHAVCYLGPQQLHRPLITEIALQLPHVLILHSQVMFVPFQVPWESSSNFVKGFLSQTHSRIEGFLASAIHLQL